MGLNSRRTVPIIPARKCQIIILFFIPNNCKAGHVCDKGICEDEHERKEGSRNDEKGCTVCTTSFADHRTSSMIKRHSVPFTAHL
jgi:hypothetical protein